MVPSMERSGYPKAFSGALMASSGTLGIIIPPSMPMIVLASITGISVGKLFHIRDHPAQEVSGGVGVQIGERHLMELVKGLYTEIPDNAIGDFIVDMGFDLKQFATKKIDYGENYRKKYIRELYDMLKADGAVVGTYAEFSKWCKENGEQGRKNRRRLYDALVADGVNVGSFAEFSSRLGIRTMHDEYDELRRISNETNLDFGIDKYTYQQFCDKYGSKGGLSNLYDALSSIAEEEGIDFNLGNKEEWIASFETDYYGNTKL